MQWGGSVRGADQSFLNITATDTHFFQMTHFFVDAIVFLI